MDIKPYSRVAASHIAPPQARRPKYMRAFSPPPSRPQEQQGRQRPGLRSTRTRTHTGERGINVRPHTQTHTRMHRCSNMLDTCLMHARYMVDTYQIPEVEDTPEDSQGAPILGTCCPRL